MRSANLLQFGSAHGVAGAMTVLEAAEYLRISRAGLYRLIQTGRLKSARLGGRRLIRRVDVDALLADAAQEA